MVKLWIPLVEDTQFQQLRKLNFKGNFQDAYITADNSYGAKTLFATWPDAKGKMELQLVMELETLDWEPLKNGELEHYRAPKTIQYPVDVERYLLPTKHMPIDGIVKQTSDKIVGKETDPLKKARLIYNWVSANMFRDNDVIGCGTGDVATILESGKLGGKCTDINSVFVALLAPPAYLPGRCSGSVLDRLLRWANTLRKPSAAVMPTAWPRSVVVSTAVPCSIWRVTAGCRPTLRM